MRPELLALRAYAARLRDEYPDPDPPTAAESGDAEPGPLDWTDPLSRPGPQPWNAGLTPGWPPPADPVTDPAALARLEDAADAARGAEAAATRAGAAARRASGENWELARTLAELERQVGWLTYELERLRGRSPEPTDGERPAGDRRVAAAGGRTRRPDAHPAALDAVAGG